MSPGGFKSWQPVGGRGRSPSKAFLQAGCTQRLAGGLDASLGWWEHQFVVLRLFLRWGGFKACPAIRRKLGFGHSEVALSCCGGRWGWCGGLWASPTWLPLSPDGCGVHWVPRSRLRVLLLPWCKARPPSRLWERDGFPLQGWLPTERGWLGFAAALRLPGVGVEGGSGGHLWQGAGCPLLAPSGSPRCGAAVPCGWVLLADAAVPLPTPAAACGS